MSAHSQSLTVSQCSLSLCNATTTHNHSLSQSVSHSLTHSQSVSHSLTVIVVVVVRRSFVVRSFVRSSFVAFVVRCRRRRRRCSFFRSFVRCHRLLSSLFVGLFVVVVQYRRCRCSLIHSLPLSLICGGGGGGGCWCFRCRRRWLVGWSWCWSWCSTVWVRWFVLLLVRGLID